MLSIQQATCNTTLYTISTRSPPTSLAAHAWRAAQAVSRFLALLAVLVTAWVEHERLSGPLRSSLPSSLSFLINNHHLDAFASSYPAGRTLLPLLIVILGLWIAFRRSYTEETLLVVQGLGVQTSTSSSSYLGTSTTRFIPTTAIQDIFIHESFIGFKVKYYLSIVVENEAQVVVVFPHTLPKLKELVTVWRSARACLYEP